MRPIVAGAAALWLALGVTVGAAPDPGRLVLEMLFRDPREAALRLAPSFAAAVPPDRLRAAAAALERQGGALLDIAPTRDGFMVHLALADVPTRITLDGRGRIAGLLFMGMAPRASPEALAQRLEALPGQVSLLALRDGRPRVAYHAELPLAVGSAFKLVVLRGVLDAIGAHRLAWDQVVRLDPAWRSLPSGFLQTWPDGTPLTVATLADAMISASDNTAADALIHLVGQEALDRLSPRNAPFLTTRALFTLKDREPEDGAASWRELPPRARRALLDRVASAPLPEAAMLRDRPGSAPEWYMSVHELCGLLAGLKDAAPFRINPGPAMASDWRTVAFKGGVEPGVLNLSIYAVAPDGHTACVAVSWNDTRELDPARLLAPVAGMLHALARSDPPG